MKYLVVTPPYESGGYYAPKEYGSDVATVEADTKKEAKVRGLRELRRMRSQWVQDCEGNPFNGLEVFEADE